MTLPEDTFWWLTLGLGLVVTAATAALLQLLLRVMTRVDEDVRQVWESGKRVAANTATTWQMEQTVVLLEEIGREMRLHDQLLSAKR